MHSCRAMDGHYPYISSAFQRDDITPLDFNAITGLSFSGEPIPLSNEVYSSAVVRNIWLRDLFGATASMKFGYVPLVQYT